MARLPKCPECDYQVDKETQRWVKHSAKTYHESCFQQFEMRKQHRSDLHNYICELYGTSVPNPLILKQIKEFQEVNNFKLKGIELALKYFHDIQGNPVHKNDDRIPGIGIVLWKYDEARNYYTQLNNIKKKAAESPLTTTTDTVYLKPIPKKTKNYIDIEGI